jgi:hypothetical protein
MALGGVLRDVLNARAAGLGQGEAFGYCGVYALEILLLAAAALAMRPLLRPRAEPRAGRQDAPLGRAAPQG